MKDLVLSNITKSYGERLVLEDLSMIFPAGSVTCIMGPSGCGKTTLFNLITGTIKADAGTISGVPDKLSIVFQEDRLCESFSAVSNIRLVTGDSMSEQEILQHFEELGIADSAYMPVCNLSGGMKRRVTIARAICYNSELILLDEALKGLDDERRHLTMDYIKKHSQGKTIICITHDPKEAEYMGGTLIDFTQLSKCMS
ncbi:MAG: ABC transporter ATP-binding protein [Oscillospiraceae bacterium]|nr:ABC transporter ATP-binding protein [Oscillospiraceae bacterium]